MGVAVGGVFVVVVAAGRAPVRDPAGAFGVVEGFVVAFEGAVVVGDGWFAFGDAAVGVDVAAAVPGPVGCPASVVPATSCSLVVPACPDKNVGSSPAVRESSTPWQVGQFGWHDDPCGWAR